MWPASTAVRPAFVTIAIRPSSMGRVAATHTPFPNFGKAEYFCRPVSINWWRVLPVRQRKISWPRWLTAGVAPTANPTGSPA
jgi:hypothetical protein